MTEQSAPSGVVTFLFTDIEGSTRRWDTDADGMRVALAAHDAVLREAIDSHDGWLFKHTGDGVCAVFASPRSAVDAAVDAQRTLELPVRMGIATGEAEFRGDDYFGAVLNRAARVMAAGHGGQILLDSATAELVSAVDLIELGQRRLRDIAKACGDIAGSSRRPARRFPAADNARHNTGQPPAADDELRRPRTEVAELETLLKDHRLVTLTGVGGVGKTRLALEVAARLVPEFPDGVWVIELAPVADPAAVPEAVAAVLGITQQPGLTIAAQRRRSVGKPDPAAGLRQLRACARRGRRHDRPHPFPLGSLEDHLRQAAKACRWRDERLWPVPSLDVALERCGVVRRARFRSAPHPECSRGYRRRHRNLSPPRWHSPRHRVGRVAVALHDRDRATGPPR